MACEGTTKGIVQHLAKKKEKKKKKEEEEETRLTASILKQDPNT